MAGNIPSMHINSVESSTCLSHPPMASCISRYPRKSGTSGGTKLSIFLTRRRRCHSIRRRRARLRARRRLVPPAVLDHDVLGIARISSVRSSSHSRRARRFERRRRRRRMLITPPKMPSVVCGYKKIWKKWKILKKKMKNEKPIFFHHFY